MRDLRDPQKLGERYQELRQSNYSIERAASAVVDNYRSDESCVEKYGKAGEVEPRWQEIQVA